MTPREDYFKHIDFDKDWDESDWEKFFSAQERFSVDLKRQTWLSRFRDASGSGLSFRHVMRRFGMDPDNPAGGPSDFFVPRKLADAPGTSGSFRFWEDGADIESVPVYCESACAAYHVLMLCEHRFHRMLSKKYKSRSHQQFQRGLMELRYHLTEAPRYIAAGHGLGYKTDMVKGNIVHCRKSLGHVNAGLGLLTRMPRNFFSLKEYRDLFKCVLALRNHLMEWVSFLRGYFIQTGF